MQFQKGIYKHYKGNYYELIDVALHSESVEPMIVYRALYGERKLWVRPAAMWNQTVTVGDETLLRFAFCPDKSAEDFK